MATDPAATPGTGAEAYVAIQPARLADTRSSIHFHTVDGRVEGGGAVAAGAALYVQILYRRSGSLPLVPDSGVAAVALNVTALEPTEATSLTVYPNGGGRPLLSSLHAAAGETTAGMVITKVGRSISGVVIVNEAGSTHVVVDVIGWFPDGGGFVPRIPVRFADTRPDGSAIDTLTASGGPVAAGTAVRVPTIGRAGLPASRLAAVAVNVTAIDPTESTYLTVSPTGENRPAVSNLIAPAGRTVSNLAIAEVGADGSISIFNAAGSTHITVDVVGWFVEDSGFVPLAPSRLVDTRADGSTIDGQSQGVGPIGAVDRLRVPVAGRGGVPRSGAAAVALNLVATEPTATTYVTVHPAIGGGGRMGADSNLNVAAGRAATNLVFVQLGDDGAIDVYNENGATHVVIDVLGWFPAGPPLTGIAGMTTGITRTCAVLLDGTVACWGQGREAASSSNAPVAVRGLTGVIAVSAGTSHSCALIVDGTVRCWGGNTEGELGNGTKTASSVPIAVGGLTDVVAISSAYRHSCALIVDGTVRCWGSNTEGELGNGTKTASSVPVPVSGLTDAVAVASGSNHSCALIADRTVRCWGTNRQGELGNGTTTGSSIPVLVSGLTDAVAISSAAQIGGALTCALRADGTVVCWGDNASDTYRGTDASTPVAVPGIANAVAISTGGSGVANAPTTCAMLVDGTTTCRGGYPGDGTHSYSHTPVTVAGLTGATSIIAGGGHSCAVLSDHTAKCWGRNQYGQLGNRSTLESLLPVVVHA